MKIKPHYIGLLSILLLFGACKARKVVPVIDNSAVEKDNAEKLMAIQQAQLNFTSLALKGKADLDMDGVSSEVNINFRMLNDQKIWISVTAIAGLEVARVMITPDSIKILNRMESIYIRKPFSYIHEFTSEQVNFSTLQSVLIGNVFDEAIKQQPEFTMLENKLQLSGRSSNIAYSLKFNEALKVTETFLQDSLASRQLMINYDDFFLDAGINLAHQIELKSAASNNYIKANLRYSKVEKDQPLDFPFSVPKRFSVKN